jgi:hypothetical protein
MHIFRQQTVKSYFVDKELCAINCQDDYKHEIRGNFIFDYILKNISNKIG